MERQGAMACIDQLGYCMAYYLYILILSGVGDRILEKHDTLHFSDMEMFMNMLAISVGVYLFSETITFFGFCGPAEYLQTLWPLCVTSHVLCCLWYSVPHGVSSLNGGLLPFLSGWVPFSNGKSKTFFLICWLHHLERNVINETDYSPNFLFHLVSHHELSFCQLTTLEEYLVKSESVIKTNSLLYPPQPRVDKNAFRQRSPVNLATSWSVAPESWTHKHETLLPCFSLLCLSSVIKATPVTEWHAVLPRGPPNERLHILTRCVNHLSWLLCLWEEQLHETPELLTLYCTRRAKPVPLQRSLTSDDCICSFFHYPQAAAIGTKLATVKEESSIDRRLWGLVVTLNAVIS